MKNNIEKLESDINEIKELLNNIEDNVEEKTGEEVASADEVKKDDNETVDTVENKEPEEVVENKDNEKEKEYEEKISNLTEEVKKLQEEIKRKTNIGLQSRGITPNKEVNINAVNQFR